MATKKTEVVELAPEAMMPATAPTHIAVPIDLAQKIVDRLHYHCGLKEIEDLLALLQQCQPISAGEPA